MEGDELVVRAGLHAEVATAELVEELVAVEAGQVGERCGPSCLQSEPVMAVLLE